MAETVGQVPRLTNLTTIGVAIALPEAKDRRWGIKQIENSETVVKNNPFLPRGNEGNHMASDLQSKDFGPMEETPTPVLASIKTSEGYAVAKIKISKVIKCKSQVL